jgi:flavin-binding protein dodecin
MLNTQQVFERLQLGTSRVTAVQAIREAIEDAADPKAKAEEIIFQVLGVKATYDDAQKARYVAMAVGEDAWKANHAIDDENTFLHACEARIDAFMANPRNTFIFVKPAYQAVQGEMKQVAKTVDIQVEVKKDGSIKKGGREAIAQALWKKHVLEATTPLSNQEFIALLMKESGMGKPGATTYAYNCRKELGEPAGGLTKSKKGRKAKV